MNVSHLSGAAGVERAALSAPHTTNEPGSSSQSSGAAAPGVDQNQFLKLLVAQLKNQDPMNPTDSSQFMGELAQFSTLQETIGMHQDLDTLVNAIGGGTKQA